MFFARALAANEVKLMAAALPCATGRGLHSSTFQLNLSHI